MAVFWSSDVCRSEEHTSELQSHDNLVCRLLLEKKKHRNNGSNSRTGHLSCARHRVLSAHARCCRACVLVPYVLLNGWFNCFFFFFFFNDTATTEIYPLSLHDALPIYSSHTKSRMPSSAYEISCDWS